MSEKNKVEELENDENLDKEIVNEQQFEEDVVEESVSEETTENQTLKAEIEKLTSEKEELYQKVLRVQADFENFKRRAKKDRENDLKYKSQDLAVELLPVLDNFERALQVEVEDGAMQNFVEGMDMIYRQLMQALNNAGIEEIKSLGEPFDPNYHQAVMQVNEEDKESNSVVEVFQKGYILKDRVIRPSMVKVNQ